MVSILPKDSVFRCLLEYQSPKFLLWRYSVPYEDIFRRYPQDRHFPATDKLSYDNHLVAVNEMPYSNFEY